jgi:allophanate hydrolase subunit 2
MGSASVHLMTGVGGRALRKGDVLPIGDEAVRLPRYPRLSGLQRSHPESRGCNGPLRVTAGPQAALFGDELYAGVWTVSEESNRMGIRLRSGAGATPIPSPSGQMITEGVPLGAVQVPPDGQPIVLFVEHQTTGGYPKPAYVISADFWRLGQLRPRDEVRFERVAMEDAIELLRDQERWLYSFV